jgi:aminoglycoside phosphotransferase (APT) family kinase protein
VQAAEVLTEEEVIPYLAARNILPLSSVVDGEVRVIDSSRRNRNFRVLCSDRPSLLIKQGVTRDSFSPIAREAAAYRLLGALADGHNGGTAVYPHTAPALDYDEDRDILILELLVPATTERTRRASLRPPSRQVARSLGTALARLHTLVPKTIRYADADRLLGVGEPGVLSVRRPGINIFRDFSSACVDLVRMVQASTEVAEQLDDLQRHWHTDALIHHDLRFDNVLVRPSQQGLQRRWGEVTLVDWETAALGDASWDVGTVLGEYLGDWLGSIPGAAGQPPERFLHLAARPLSLVQPAIAAFWAAYAAGRGFDCRQAHEHLMRATRYAGLKLIQSALEQVQRAAYWSVGSVCFLQTGTNVLAKPEDAATILLGLSEER